MRITRPLILLVLLGLTGFTYGQKITGEIPDKSSRLPIGSATVSAGTSQTVQSDASGKFTLDLQGAINTGAAGAQLLNLVDNVEIPSLQMINTDDIESDVSIFAGNRNVFCKFNL